MNAKLKTRIIRAALAAVLAFSLQPSAFATLTAIVQPGYQFPTDGSVPLSWDLINLLATPTISIYGTIGGSNTLSQWSVTGEALNPNVLTAGGGLAFDGNTPPGIEIATAGVLTNMLNTNDWAWPLSQPAQAGAVRLNWNPILFSTPTNLFGSGTNPGPFTLNYDGSSGLTTNKAGLTISNEPPAQLGTALIVQGILFGGQVTNYYTNFNTILIGNTNGTGTLALLGANYSLGTTNVIISGTNGGVTSWVTNAVPILNLSGSSGSFMPLTAGARPNTNRVKLAAPATYYTNTASFGIFGGTPPYTSSQWSWGSTVFKDITVDSVQTNSTPTNVTFIIELDPNQADAYANILYSGIITDATGMIAPVSFLIYYYY